MCVCIYDLSFHRLRQSVCAEGLQSEHPALPCSTPGCTPLGWAAGWCLWRPQRRNGCSPCRWRTWNGSRLSCHYLGSSPQTSSRWTPDLPARPAEDLEGGQSGVVKCIRYEWARRKGFTKTKIKDTWVTGCSIRERCDILQEYISLYCSTASWP